MEEKQQFLDIGGLAQYHKNLHSNALAAKADKTESVPVTISASGWKRGTGDSDYPYYYDIPVVGVTAQNSAIITIAPDSQSTASECGMCTVNETLEGCIWIYSKSIPSANISAEYQVVNGVVSAGSADSSMNYSTEPQQIGTWIDGSPVYRVAFEHTLEEISKQDKAVPVQELAGIDFITWDNNCIYLDGHALLFPEPMTMADAYELKYVVGAFDWNDLDVHFDPVTVIGWVEYAVRD